MTRKGLKMGMFGMALTFAVVLGSCGSLSKGDETTTVFWDTSLLQNVTRLTDDGLAKDWSRVSADGTRLLYCESSKTVARSDYSEPYNYWNIVLLRDVNSPAKTRLITEYSYAPAWYENNNNFLYVVSESGGSKIVRSAVSGGGKTYITRNPVGKLDARPTIRGGVILCDTEVYGKRQIVSMKENGTEITMMGEGYFPSWHPTEPKFVFVREDDIYEMDLVSTQVTLIYSDPKFRSTMPSYSYDGQYILFQKGAEQKVTGQKVTSAVGGLFKKVKNVVTTQTRWQIFVIKSDGSNLSPLTSGTVDAYSPSWDENNNVYFVCNASGKTEVYRARISLE